MAACAGGFDGFQENPGTADALPGAVSDLQPAFERLVREEPACLRRQVQVEAGLEGFREPARPGMFPAAHGGQSRGGAGDDVDDAVEGLVPAERHIDLGAQVIPDGGVLAAVGGQGSRRDPEVERIPVTARGELGIVRLLEGAGEPFTHRLYPSHAGSAPEPDLLAEDAVRFAVGIGTAVLSAAPGDADLRLLVADQRNVDAAHRPLLFPPHLDVPPHRLPRLIHRPLEQDLHMIK